MSLSVIYFFFTIFIKLKTLTFFIFWKNPLILFCREIIRFLFYRKCSHFFYSSEKTSLIGYLYFRKSCYLNCVLKMFWFYEKIPLLNFGGEISLLFLSLVLMTFCVSGLTFAWMQSCQVSLTRPWQTSCPTASRMSLLYSSQWANSASRKVNPRRNTDTKQTTNTWYL